MHKSIHPINLDVVIIGAGPIGLTCAIEAKKSKLNYLVIEKGSLVDSLYHFPTNMTFFSTSKLLEIGNVPFVSHYDKPTRREALEYYRRVYDSWKLNISFYETVNGLEQKQGYYIIETDQRRISAKYIIIATGFYGQANLMNVPGESLSKVRHYYQEAHPYIGQNVLIVGAANSACDVALELYHKGSQVSMVIRGDSINDRVKYWIKPNIENRIKEGSIDAYFQSEIKEIKEDSVIIKTPDGLIEIENDYVLAMTGYTPDFTWLESLGIKRNPADVNQLDVDSNTLETNLSGVYVAGVVVAGKYTSKLFIENTRQHGQLIISHIREKEKIQLS
ncbi:YpdA family putative bacillithiol disulfide reductase [Membranihabitans marinus]|uniref:YpdA family putative bacillithiol disulfide reductase n=1 Tax=Membranihabitans marinus TaxID=1227546 RepID=UPI001F012D04|nr:YpdA family putative bacillithiol disulfide reductase [Membranihabitans marinus]